MCARSAADLLARSLWVGIAKAKSSQQCALERWTFITVRWRFGNNSIERNIGVRRVAVTGENIGEIGTQFPGAAPDKKFARRQSAPVWIQVSAILFFFFFRY